jgi:hypothetical protein
MNFIGDLSEMIFSAFAMKERTPTVTEWVEIVAADAPTIALSLDVYNATEA